jgi:hypothetical protein
VVKCALATVGVRVRVDSAGSGQDQACREHSNEPSGLTKGGEYHNRQNDCLELIFIFMCFVVFVGVLVCQWRIARIKGS